VDGAAGQSHADLGTCLGRVGLVGKSTRADELDQAHLTLAVGLLGQFALLIESLRALRSEAALSMRVIERDAGALHGAGYLSLGCRIGGACFGQLCSRRRLARRIAGFGGKGNAELNADAVIIDIAIDVAHAAADQPDLRALPSLDLGECAICLRDRKRAPRLGKAWV